jgi:hypothetical protein
VAALGGELPAGAAADRFAADVRAFAAEFWALAPAARRARWEALTARAAGPAAGWLRELGDALDITPTVHAEPAAAAVTAVLGELAVLPGRVRAERRRAWLADSPDQFAARRRAARSVIRDDLPLARLEPTLFDYLATGAPLSAVGTSESLWGRLRRILNFGWWLTILVVLLAPCVYLIWPTSSSNFALNAMGLVIGACSYFIWLASRK